MDTYYVQIEITRGDNNLNKNNYFIILKVYGKYLILLCSPVIKKN